MTNNLPYLNIGCGKVLLPCERPAHHALVDEAIYAYPHWHNVDKLPMPGIDEQLDVMRYPWPWADNSFGGALLGHVVEHVPHDIRADASERGAFLAGLQDGWYAFLAELHRVLVDGAVAHILSPYVWSNGAFADPTHRRFITEHTFTHGFTGDVEYHEYNVGSQWRLVEAPKFDATPAMPEGEASLEAFTTRINQVYNIYGKMQVVKA